MGLEPEKESGGFLHAARRAWFNLTVGEQQALVVILALFFLGLAVRAWRAGGPDGAGPSGKVETAVRPSCGP